MDEILVFSVQRLYKWMKTTFFLAVVLMDEFLDFELVPAGAFSSNG
jgi:hypothetical protein